MLPAGTAMYLLVPTVTNERVLHPGLVVQSNGGEFMLEFDSEIAPPAGSDVNVFFDRGGRFYQQGCTITAISSADGPSAKQSVALTRVGDPVSADSRGSYRVSVTALEFAAKVDKERACPLVDISPEGLAVVTRTNHRLGTILQMALDCQGQSILSRARVQTIRMRPDGKFRCGLLVPSTESKARRSLQKLTAIVQRVQLQRLRRSA